MDRRNFIRSSISAAVAASLPGTQALAASLLHTPTTVPSNIDAITGATLSSKAMAGGVRDSIKLAAQIK